jgi:hypothetical protein
MLSQQTGSRSGRAPGTSHRRHACDGFPGSPKRVGASGTTDFSGCKSLHHKTALKINRCTLSLVDGLGSPSYRDVSRQTGKSVVQGGRSLGSPGLIFLHNNGLHPTFRVPSTSLIQSSSFSRFLPFVLFVLFVVSQLSELFSVHFLVPRVARAPEVASFRSFAC